MPINFACPHCGKQTIVADQYAGQSGPCAGCGRTISVPAAGMERATSVSPQTGGTSVLVLLAILGIGGLLFIGLIAALIIPAVGSARNSSRRMLSANNMKMIGLALHNYHDVYGELPPQYVVDSTGKPLYSWRVLILPYIEQDAIYKAWDKSKAWDSPENSHLSNIVIPVFRMPDEPAGSNQTSYLAVSGNNTLFEGKKSVSFARVTDGLSNTVMVVESKGSGVQWAEPRDLDISQFTSINSGVPGAANSGNAKGAQALFGDASVQMIPANTPSQTLQLLGDRQDGNAVVLPKR